MKRYRLYVNGEWVEGVERRTIRSPWDGRPLAEVDWAGEEQVEAALAAAAAAAETTRASNGSRGSAEGSPSATLR